MPYGRKNRSQTRRSTTLPPNHHGNENSSREFVERLRRRIYFGSLFEGPPPTHTPMWPRRSSRQIPRHHITERA